jgi:hypothetical protein
MPTYKITFFKNLLSSDGHNFRCPQQVITTTAQNSNEAVEAAKQKLACQWNIRDWRQHADEFEVMEDPALAHTGVE